MKILKVAHIVEPYPHAGGFGTSVGAAARGLVARGHEVTILSADHGPRPEFDQASVEFVYLPQIGSFRRIGIAPDVLRFARRRLRDFDVAHFYGTYDLISPAIAHVARQFGVPYVVEPKGNLPPATRSLIKKRVYAAVVGRRVWRGARAVISNSSIEHERLATLFSPTPVIQRRITFPKAPADIDRCAIEQWRQELSGGDGRRLILFLGRIAQVKALDILVQACAGVTTPITLVLAGPIDGDNSLSRTLLTARELNVRIEVVPPVHAEQKWALLAASDVVALISHSESFGLAAAEAMATGVPVVVSKACGIAEDVARANAGLVVDTDPVVIAGALNSLLLDAKLWKSARANALALARQQGGDAPIIQLEQIYNWARGVDPTFTDESSWRTLQSAS